MKPQRLPRFYDKLVMELAGEVAAVVGRLELASARSGLVKDCIDSPNGSPAGTGMRELQHQEAFGSGDLAGSRELHKRGARLTPARKEIDQCTLEVNRPWRAHQIGRAVRRPDHQVIANT